MTETFSERSKQEEAKLTELTACDRFLSGWPEERNNKNINQTGLGFLLAPLAS
jgi:hypothetical protein